MALIPRMCPVALKFDHVGVVVTELSVGRNHFSCVFGISRWTREFADPLNKVNVQFGLDDGGMCYEIISPLGSDGPLSRALKSRNPILNHIAYLTDNLDGGTDHLRSYGCIPAGHAQPAIAYDGCDIQFFVSPLGFIIELIQAIGHTHQYAI